MSDEAIPTGAERLKEALNILGGVTAEDLVRRGVLGTSFDFSAGVPLFERTLTLFGDVKDAEVSSLPSIPDTKFREFADQAEAAIQAFEAIVDFAPSEHGDPTAVRDALITSLENQYPVSSGPNHFRSASS